jgi:prepilin-type processing-associated H-X9-DG protein
MHSWRVLLLPYFGDQEKLLYEQYDFTKPWDGPENAKLAQRMPTVYACPDDPDAEFGDTSYLLVLGKGAVFDAGVSASHKDITDGLSDTTMVVESVGAGVSWLSPTDLDLRTMPLHVNREQNGGICSHHASGGANVLMADGSVRTLPDHLSAEEVRAMITIDGREPVASEPFTVR